METKQCAKLVITYGSSIYIYIPPIPIFDKLHFTLLVDQLPCFTFVIVKQFTVLSLGALLLRIYQGSSHFLANNCTV